ncbi:hypothetical protein Q6326_32610, partial [Klebsiella pneumoniae]
SGGERIAQEAKGEGLAGLDAHAMEDDATQPFDGGAYMILLTHRDTAATDYQIGLVPRPAQGRMQVKRIVQKHAQVD